MDKLEAMRTENIVPVRLDVTDEAQVEAAINFVIETKGQLDVLINNAGYGLYGTIEGLTGAQVRHAFDVNVFGLGNVTRAALPHMRLQGAGTIVNIGSVVGKVSSPVLGWYAASKHAVEGMTDALRLEVKPFGIHVVLIEPGWINTGFEDVAVTTLKNSDDPECYDELKTNFEKVVRNGYEGGAGPEVVSKAVLKAIQSDKPKARYAVGPQAALSIRMKRLTTDGLMDAITERMYG